MPNDQPLVPAEDDIGLLCMVIANGFTEAVLARLAAAGLGDSKFAHRFIVQGLLAGDRTVTDLAERLGISVQAVSKTVRDMESLGYLERRPDPADRRSSVLALSGRGERSLSEARAARLEVMQGLNARLGPERAATTVEALRELAEAFGGLAALANRRLRPL